MLCVLPHCDALLYGASVVVFGCVFCCIPDVVFFESDSGATVCYVMMLCSFVLCCACIVLCVVLYSVLCRTLCCVIRCVVLYFVLCCNLCCVVLCVVLYFMLTLC